MEDKKGGGHKGTVPSEEKRNSAWKNLETGLKGQRYRQQQRVMLAGKRKEVLASEGWAVHINRTIKWHFSTKPRDKGGGMQH